MCCSCVHEVLYVCTSLYLHTATAGQVVWYYATIAASSRCEGVCMFEYRCTNNGYELYAASLAVFGYHKGSQSSFPVGLVSVIQRLKFMQCCTLYS